MLIVPPALSVLNQYAAFLFASAERTNERVHLFAQLRYGERGTAFEGQPAAVSRLLNGLKNLGIMDFARAGLLSAGIVRYVEMSDQIDIFRDIADQVSLRYLLVIDIEEKPAGRAVHSAQHIERLATP